MLTQVKNAKFYLQAKLGLNQRGAEMVEYAIVLACIAAVAAIYYTSAASSTSGATGSLTDILKTLWEKVSKKVSTL